MDNQEIKDIVLDLLSNLDFLAREEDINYRYEEYADARAGVLKLCEIFKVDLL